MNRKEKERKPSISLGAYIEQLAAFLRRQTSETFTALKQPQILLRQSAESASGAIQQIAKLLREETHKALKPKKTKRVLRKKSSFKKRKNTRR